MPLIESLHKLSFSLAPGLCLLCDHPSYRLIDLCEACESDLPRLGAHCAYCAEPLQTESGICVRCLMEPPPFSAVFCAYDYSHPIDQLIQKFKDHGSRAAGYVITHLAIQNLTESLATAITDDCVITSVPIHRSKLRRRGFNQAQLIANWLAASLEFEAQHHLIKRVEDKGSQRSLNVNQREINLKGVFQPTHVNDIRHKTMVLVDDVITTTSTIREISHILVEAGAADVIVFALARTAKDEGQRKP